MLICGQFFVNKKSLLYFFSKNWVQVKGREQFEFVTTFHFGMRSCFIAEYTKKFWNQKKNKGQTHKSGSPSSVSLFFMLFIMCETVQLLRLGKVRINQYFFFSNLAKAFQKTPHVELCVSILPCGRGNLYLKKAGDSPQCSFFNTYNTASLGADAIPALEEASLFSGPTNSGSKNTAVFCQGNLNRAKEKQL